MQRDWEQIGRYFAELRLRPSSVEMDAALGGVENIAKFINQGELRHCLFGWTSMFDLCVQQSDVKPYSGPYLRISPLPSGKINFRYFDTAIEHRQWHRAEDPVRVIPRLETFFDQLGWFLKSA